MFYVRVISTLERDSLEKVTVDERKMKQDDNDDNIELNKKKSLVRLYLEEGGFRTVQLPGDPGNITISGFRRHVADKLNRRQSRIVLEDIGSIDMLSKMDDDDSLAGWMDGVGDLETSMIDPVSDENDQLKHVIGGSIPSVYVKTAYRKRTDFDELEFVDTRRFSSDDSFLESTRHQSSPPVELTPEITSDSNDHKAIPQEEQPPPSLEELDSQLNNIVREIWLTETSYVEDLEVMVNIYLLPLRDGLKNRETIMSPSLLPKIFSNVEQILSVNQELLAQLDICMEAQPRHSIDVKQVLTKVSQIFSKMCKPLKIYAQYIINNQHAIDTLKMASKNPAYLAFEDLTRKSCNQLRLEGFLVKPVQRLCRYPLFFKELIKAANLHPGLDSEVITHLTSAKQSIEMVAEFVNGEKRMKENREKLKEIEGTISGLNKCKKFRNFSSNSNRIFYREGNALKTNPKGKKQPRKIYLFNDCLIYTKDNVFKGEIPMMTAVIRQADQKKFPNGFQARLLHDKKNRTYTFLLPNQIELQEWMKSLNTITELNTHRQPASSKRIREMYLQNWN